MVQMVLRVLQEIVVQVVLQVHLVPQVQLELQD